MRLKSYGYLRVLKKSHTYEAIKNEWHSFPQKSRELASFSGHDYDEAHRLRGDPVADLRKKNLAELFEFWRTLGENQSLKTKFFELSKRSDRENFINELGFNSSTIRKALSEIKVESKGKQFNLLDWMDDPQQGNTIELPVRAAVSILRKNCSSASLKNIEKRFAHHVDVLQRHAGGISPQAHQSRAKRSDTNISKIDREPANFVEDFETLEPQKESGHQDSFDHSSFQKESHSETDSFSHGNRDAERDSYQAKLESLTITTETETSHHSTNRDQEGAPGIAHASSREIVSNEIKDQFKTAISAKINDYTSFDVNYSSSTITLYDQEHFDVTATLGVDGTINPELSPSTGNSHSPSISFSDSDLDFNITFGVTYSKDSYALADYDIELQGSVSSDITLTFHKEPGQQGISDVTISANGLTFEIDAGLIKDINYNGEFVDVTVNPSIEFSFNISRANGLTVYKPEFNLGLQVSYNSPILGYLEQGWAYLREGIEYVEEAFSYVDSFAKQVYSDANQALDEVEQGLGDAEQELEAATSDISNAVNTATATVEQISNTALNDISGEVGQITSTVSSSLRSAASSLEDAAETALADFENDINQVTSTLTNTFDTAVDELDSELDTGFNTLDQEINDFANDFTSTFSNSTLDNAVNSLVSTANSGITEAEQGLSTATSDLTTTFNDAVSQLDSNADLAINDAEAGIQQAASDINTAIDDAAKDIDNAINTGLDNLETEINYAASAVTSTVDTAANDIESAASSAASYLDNQIANISSEIENDVNDAADYFDTAIDSALGDAENDFNQATSLITNTFDNSTIDDAVNTIDSAADNTINNLENGVDQATSDITNTVDSVTGSFENAADSAISDINEGIDDASSAITNSVDNAAESIENTTDSAVNDIEQGADDAWNSVESTADQVGNDLNPENW